MKKDKYYKNIGLIRFLAILAVLLYHLNILKGGYLAVCMFFLLSSYLSCISAFKQKKFSLKEYYKKTFLKIYLPLIIVVFSSIFVVSFIKDVAWINIKPEVKSILFGYNNFWQLSTNLDYFAKNINCPFTHLWYIAILIQFDLLFPFIYQGLKKIGDKVNKLLPIIISSLIGIISVVIFVKTGTDKDIMFSYYNTFARMFSLWFGVALGFIHIYYKPLVLKDNKLKKIIFYIYLLISIILFITVDASSKLYIFSMIFITFISMRLIDYGISFSNKELYITNKINNGIKSITSVGYEIYLVQYPIIFIFQYINMNKILEFILIILLIVIISYIINFALNLKNKKNSEVTRLAVFILLSVLSILGIYKYIITEDYTKEMKELEEQLAENAEKILAKQEEYASRENAKNTDWEEQLKELENGEKNIENVVKKLNVVGVGDSVMLGAVDNLYKTFTNGYFDAKISRTAWSLNGILEDLKNKKMLGNPIVINLGSNGDCSTSCKDKIMETIGDREVFWINTTNLTNVNEILSAYAEKHSNMHMIDWYTLSRGHEEYFYADKIHLTGSGRVAYTKVIYDEIYKVYLEKYKKEKEDIIKEHEEKESNKITFVGNEILFNAFNDIHEKFSEDKFFIDKDYTFESLKDELKKAIEENNLSNRVVFALDKFMNLQTKDYKELIKLCDGREIYFVTLSNNSLSNIDENNVTIIDFYQEIKNNEDYLMVDKTHLSNKGNSALVKILQENFSN